MEAPSDPVSRLLAALAGLAVTPAPDDLAAALQALPDAGVLPSPWGDRLGAERPLATLDAAPRPSASISSRQP